MRAHTYDVRGPPSALLSQPTTQEGGVEGCLHSGFYFFS